MIKVAIANDTLIALEALRRIIATDPAYQLIWTARDGAEAVALCQRDRPDLMLMDLLMPKIDGVEATRQIMARSPCAILIVTASVHRNTSKVFEAMGHGALDVVKTPSLGLSAIQSGTVRPPLLAKMAIVSRFIGQSTDKNDRAIAVKQSDRRSPSATATSPKLIVMGASTGGPKALASVLSQLPARFSAAIVIIQHIDKQFAAGLADWLNEQSALPVALAQIGDRPQAGKVLVAQANSHLILRRDRSLAYTSSDMGKLCCPSVDVFFESVARYWDRPGQAVLLTGMGRDGAIGMGLLRAARWQTIAQSEASCVVYGMPRAAVESGAASLVLEVAAIAQRLRHL